MMDISVWEKESFFEHKDIIIVGSGLSGLWCAYHLKKLQPQLTVSIVDRGLIPTGASTRNAGFACFGSLTELMQDIQQMGEEKTLELVSMRFNGLQQIQQVFEPAKIGFSLCGGYELITGHDQHTKTELADGIETLNKLLSLVIPAKQIFLQADHNIKAFGFANIRHLVQNEWEGYLHSGKLCQLMLQNLQCLGVTILNGIAVTGYEKMNSRYLLSTEQGIELSASQLLICTNAFAKQLLPALDVQPARGQILVTEEIPGLKFQGAFHADEGYYYFRNLGSRILIGGARNSDFNRESTDVMSVTSGIQGKLEHFLQEHIIPGIPFRIASRWSGIMGMGSGKLPIVEEIEPGLFCAVRMSGMGVALTPVVGETVAKKMLAR